MTPTNPGSPLPDERPREMTPEARVAPRCTTTRHVFGDRSFVCECGKFDCSGEEVVEVAPGRAADRGEEPEVAAPPASPPTGELLQHLRNCSWYGSYGNGDCSCALKERQEIQTWQNLHTAWMKRANEAEASVAALSARLAEVEEELRVTDQLLTTRHETLRLIPPCPAHGPDCQPHAQEWITAVSARAAEMARAHSASFGALASISRIVTATGDVDDYEDVVRAVDALHSRAAAAERERDALRKALEFADSTVRRIASPWGPNGQSRREHAETALPILRSALSAEQEASDG